MILTVTLNPSIDKIFLIPDFSINRLNRTESSLTIAGGKGINASIVPALLGEEVVATGFLGGAAGRDVSEYLRSKGVTTNFAHIDGTTRTNYIVLDGRQQTQINEKGPKIKPEELQNFFEIYERALSQSSFMVMAGSLPPGIDSDIYKTLVLKAKDKGIKSLVNASGETLERAIEAGPHIVKPDIRTRQKVLGITLDSLRSKLKVAEKVLSFGSEMFLLSEGTLEQLIVTKDKALIVKPQKLTLKSRVGAQDSIVGAFVYGVKNKMNFEETAKMAMCAGYAAAKKIINTPENAEEIRACELNLIIEKVDSES